MTDDDLYEGREQTLIKHLILEQYLERFAHIIGYYWGSITYVDCFSGPWQSRSEQYSDTSFDIAIQQLRKARENLRDNSKEFEIRCMFLEKDKKAYKQLTEYARQFDEDIEIERRNAKFEDSVSEIVAFVKKRPNTFPFIFVDPTGWRGISLDVIRPLLQLNPGEVLINFMTGHIRRFIHSMDNRTQESFEKVYGTSDYRATLEGLKGQDREDAAVWYYLKRICAAGNFPFSSMAMVLRPHDARSHFHLLYLTRHPKGIKEFKKSECRAMKEMEQTRAKSQQNRRVKKSKQKELFSDEQGDESPHFVMLRERYLERAQQAIWNQIQNAKSVLYDDLWATALRYPLVWDDDLKTWLKNWKSAKQITIQGMTEKERVPKLNSNYRVVFTDPNPG